MFERFRSFRCCVNLDDAVLGKLDRLEKCLSGGFARAAGVRYAGARFVYYGLKQVTGKSVSDRLRDQPRSWFRTEGPPGHRPY